MSKKMRRKGILEFLESYCPLSFRTWEANNTIHTTRVRIRIGRLCTPFVRIFKRIEPDGKSEIYGQHPLEF